VYSTATPHRLITSQGCLGVRRRRPLFGIVAAQTPLKAWREPIPQYAGRIHSWVYHERDLATYSFERLDASQSYLGAHNCISRRASRRRRAAAAINLSPFRTRPPGPNRACRSHSWPLSPVGGSASCGADHTTLWFAETVVKRCKTILKRTLLKGVQLPGRALWLRRSYESATDQATFVRLVIQTTDSDGMRCGRRKPCR
jgi:hypothetical protein